MKHLFCWLALLLVVGCDNNIETKDYIQRITIREDANIKQPIGEAYVGGWDYCNIGDYNGCKDGMVWMPFTASDQTDEHCFESNICWEVVGDHTEPCKQCFIKIKGQWIDKSKTFLYADMPDQYQPMRDKIENTK